MRRSDVYPHDALTGSCFVTGDYDPSQGVVDLEIYVDALPVYGRLCLSPKAVRDMVTCLGWEWPSAELEQQVLDVAVDNVRLREENQRLRKAMAGILRAAELAKLEDWMVET